MLIYSVVGEPNLDCFHQQGLFEMSITPKNNLISFYELYGKKNQKAMMKDIDYLSKNILIDSGAFSLQSHKKDLVNMDIKDFFKEYCNFIKKYDEEKIQGFFELDIGNIIGIDNLLKSREYLFTLTDKIIPVWHKYLGINTYKQMCKDYDYISFSCVRNRNVKVEDIPHFIKYAHKNDCKIHGLGQSNRAILDKNPFDSTDSYTWFMSQRFGKYKNKQKINSKWLSKNYCIATTQEYLEETKLQKYYYHYWYPYFKRLGRYD